MKQIRLAQKRQKYAFRIQILDKLNKMHHVDLSNSQFSKIRTKESTNTQQNSGKYDSTLSKSRLNKENVSVHLRSFN